MDFEGSLKPDTWSPLRAGVLDLHNVMYSPITLSRVSAASALPPCLRSWQKPSWPRYA